MRFITFISFVLLACLGPALPVAAATLSNSSVVTSPISTLSAGIGIRLVDIPVETQDDPRAKAYIVDRISPAATIKRRIEVRNNSDTPQSVRIYSGSAHIVSGSFVGDSDPSVSELTSWITIATPEMDLAAGEAKTDLVTITAPADAVDGEQYAAIWAEVRSGQSAGTHVVQANRVGVRVYLAVGVGSATAPDFTIGSLSASRNAQGVPILTASVKNTGGRTLDVTGVASLTNGPGGLSAGPYSGQRATTIVTGETQELVIPLAAQIPKGAWTAKLDLSSGLTAHSISVRVVFPAPGAMVAITASKNLNFGWLVGGIVTVPLLLIAGFFLYLQKRRKALVSVS